MFGSSSTISTRGPPLMRPVSARCLSVVWELHVGLVVCALRSRQAVRIQDLVAVALLGEEPLAVLRELLVDGVAGDERVEVGRQPALLRPQEASQPLGFFLP